MEYCKGDQAEETEKKLADKKVEIVEEREVKRRKEEAERRWRVAREAQERNREALAKAKEEEERLRCVF